MLKCGQYITLILPSPFSEFRVLQTRGCAAFTFFASDDAIKPGFLHEKLHSGSDNEGGR